MRPLWLAHIVGVVTRCNAHDLRELTVAWRKTTISMG
jgi:hypothetical protein